jgi:hypothetical protein
MQSYFLVGIERHNYFLEGRDRAAGAKKEETELLELKKQLRPLQSAAKQGLSIKRTCENKGQRHLECSAHTSQEGQRWILVIRKKTSILV